jgi:hypothetical protein
MSSMCRIGTDNPTKVISFSKKEQTIEAVNATQNFMQRNWHQSLRSGSRTPLESSGIEYLIL